jgi:hypothetical protein
VVTLFNTSLCGSFLKQQVVAWFQYDSALMLAFLQLGKTAGSWFLHIHYRSFQIKQLTPITVLFACVWALLRHFNGNLGSLLHSFASLLRNLRRFYVSLRWLWLGFEFLFCGFALLRRGVGRFCAIGVVKGGGWGGALLDTSSQWQIPACDQTTPQFIGPLEKLTGVTPLRSALPELNWP